MAAPRHQSPARPAIWGTRPYSVVAANTRKSEPPMYLHSGTRARAPVQDGADGAHPPPARAGAEGPRRTPSPWRAAARGAARRTR